MEVVAKKKHKLLKSFSGKIVQQKSAQAAITNSVAIPAPAICKRFLCELSFHDSVTSV